MAYHYYESILDRDERRVYEEVRRGLAAMAPSIRTLRLDARRLSDVVFCLRLDEPRLAFVRDVSFRAVRDADHVEVIPHYAFEPTKMRAVSEVLTTRVKKISSAGQGKTPEEKLRFVHDWILDNIRYDKLYKNYAHEVIGPLCHGVGVCEGIAKTVKILLDALDVESLVVIGRENPDKHGIEGMRHAWNIVRLHGENYHMDATFDLSLSRFGVKRYDYYLLSDDEIARDHREAVWPIPRCPVSGGFYASERRTAASLPALEKLLIRLTKKRTRVIAFQWDDPAGTFPVEEIARVCGEFAGERNMRIRLSCNRTQRVVLLTLIDENAQAPTEEREKREGESLYEQLPD